MNTFPFRNISAWLDEPAGLQPKLNGDITTDILIIGGGYTGLYTAIGLREAGLDVAVLEKDFSGAGGSGRNSGYVDGLIGKDFPSLLKLYSPERARELCSFATEAVRKLEQFIQENDIRCEYEPNGNIMAAVHPKQIKKLKKVAEAGDALGMDFTYLGPEAMRERGIPSPFVAGLFDTVGGTLNPGLLISSLRKIALEKGVQLFEKTPVLRLDDSQPVAAHCPEGSVKAEAAVLATNAYTNALDWKKRLVTPIYTAMCETEPLTTDQLDAIGWKGREGIYTAHEQLENYRLTARNTIVTGGKYVKIPYGFQVSDTYVPALFTRIEKVFRERFHQFPDIEMKAFWGGWLGMVLDFMPVLGVTGRHRNIHYGLGFSGHGIPQTLMMGEMLAEQVQGREHPRAGVLERRVMAMPPEPIKWLASQALSGVFSSLDYITDQQTRRLKQ
ncbi:MAG: FAD-dependent oxidoreductase [Lewinellaceae bacterium]|nr:FAD-dependent oxidoreductase [Lewinellaceae bacterium]